MYCLTTGEMLDYVLQVLTDEQESKVETHIAHCRMCAEGVQVCFQTNNTWERFEAVGIPILK